MENNEEQNLEQTTNVEDAPQEEKKEEVVEEIKGEDAPQEEKNEQVDEKNEQPEENNDDKKRKHDQIAKFDLNNMTVRILKEMLNKKGLDEKGKKSILIDRLKENVEENELQTLAEEVLEEEDKSESDFSDGSSYETGDNPSKNKDLETKKIKKLTFAQLKSYAKKKGLETKGKKEEILKRVLSIVSKN